MKRTKISKVDAFDGMSEIDHTVMDTELHALFHSDQRKGREMTDQFFLNSDNTITLEVYWGGKLVKDIRFNNNGKLSEQGRKVVDQEKLCENCNQRKFTQLCDHAVGTGIVTSIDFQELTETCDKKLCRECAVNIWANCDVCPDHAAELKQKLLKA